MSKLWLFYFYLALRIIFGLSGDEEGDETVCIILEFVALLLLLLDKLLLLVNKVDGNFALVKVTVVGLLLLLLFIVERFTFELDISRIGWNAWKSWVDGDEADVATLTEPLVIEAFECCGWVVVVDCLTWNWFVLELFE